MRFIVEPRHCIVRLRLKIGRANAAIGGGSKRTHPVAPDQVRHKRGDENGLSRPRQPGDAKADHGLEECLRYGGQCRFDTPCQPVCDIVEDHPMVLCPVRRST